MKKIIQSNEEYIKEIKKEKENKTCPQCGYTKCEKTYDIFDIFNARPYYICICGCKYEIKEDKK